MRCSDVKAMRRRRRRRRRVNILRDDSDLPFGFSRNC
jgi:hypothetical protein